MTILETISSDLDWREKEIASMRLLLSSANVTHAQKQVLLRAAWAMLYAHYEGFCKNTLAAYYDVIVKLGMPCKCLPLPTKLFALGDTLRRLKNLPDSDLLSEIMNFPSNHLSMIPKFPDVDTQSNLWPDVLIELLKEADLETRVVENHRLKLNTLVSRRNKIAHGENNIITEISYYHTYEKVVYDVMYDLAMQVDDRLSKSPYSAQQVAATGTLSGAY